jgi:hypothetical protein|tara:strand:+ start:592 stop:819 length:228 start_codon:yes stop_codon:yes gene_type:complete
MANDNTKNFVDSLDKGNNDQAGIDLKSALGDKVSAALDDRKVDVAKTLFQNVQKSGTEAIETPAEEVPSDDKNTQ